MPKDNEVYDYVVVLRDTHGRLVRIAGAWISFLGICMLAYRWAFIPGSGASILFLAPCIILEIWNLMRMRRNRHVRHWPVLALAGSGMLVVPPFHLAGIPLLVLARMESFAMKRTEVGVSNQGIRFNTMLGKAYAWSELQNVVLRDGLLTIDFKDNRLFQRYTDDFDDDEYEAGEDEFNLYCREKLNGSPSNK